MVSAATPRHALVLRAPGLAWARVGHRPLARLQGALPKGGAVAVFATARKLAQLAYRMLRYGTSYVDVGAAAYEERFRSRQLHGLRSSANSLGYDLVPQAVTPD